MRVRLYTGSANPGLPQKALCSVGCDWDIGGGRTYEHVHAWKLRGGSSSCCELAGLSLSTRKRVTRGALAPAAGRLPNVKSSERILGAGGVVSEDRGESAAALRAAAGCQEVGFPPNGRGACVEQ